jgi:hypothetical protein
MEAQNKKRAALMMGGQNASIVRVVSDTLKQLAQ